MTADAKVGLLLGLFFIVLIAFLINGLPTFLQSSTADDVVKTTIVAPSGPDLVIDHRVTETAQRLIPGIPLRATEPPQEVIVLDQPAKTTDASAPETSAAQSPITETSPVQTSAVSVPQPQAQSIIAAQAGQLPLPAAQQVVQPSRTLAADTRTHIVQKDETLSSIAKKYYGPQEGNRRAVIQQLFEANKDVLPSPDKVEVGKKLVIPSLKSSAPARPSPAETLIQKHSDIFERSAAPLTAKPAANGKTVEYVVQEGETLWKIAEKTLGDGRKFNILVQLNKDRLNNADQVVQGTKILIPAP